MSDREIVVTREFSAPRDRVFEGLTRPDLLRRWVLSPPGWELVACELEPRVGGTFLYLWRNAEGEETAMRGLIREFVPPERVVHVETVDGQPGDTPVATTLEERDGVTTLRLVVTCPSPQARDAMLASDMAAGIDASYDRLATLLAETTS